jgi:hypothetical protein
MLFDLEDYYVDGVIGINQNGPLSPQTWENNATTYRATRDAFFKAFEEWIPTSEICESTCSDRIQTLKQEYFDNKDIFTATGVIFWNGLIAGNLTKEQHTTYSNALDELMYSVRKLLSILDGDNFKIQEI